FDSLPLREVIRGYLDFHSGVRTTNARQNRADLRGPHSAERPSRNALVTVRLENSFDSHRPILLVKQAIRDVELARPLLPSQLRDQRASRSGAAPLLLPLTHTALCGRRPPRAVVVKMATRRFGRPRALPWR